MRVTCGSSAVDLAGRRRARSPSTAPLDAAATLAEIEAGLEQTRQLERNLSSLSESAYKSLGYRLVTFPANLFQPSRQPWQQRREFHRGAATEPRPRNLLRLPSHVMRCACRFK